MILRKLMDFSNKLKTTYSSTKDFAVERNKQDISLFNEVVKYIKREIKKRSIIISGHSEGSIKRLLSVLKEHDLNIVRKIENINQIYDSPRKFTIRSHN